MNPRSFAALAAVTVASAVVSTSARADDNIFPPAPAAKSFIDFDGRGFLINGQRTFLASGSLHYARVPRALWRDRLLKMKRAGFNVVQTYAFWNFHEPKEGKWDFSGDRDLGAFLDLVHEMGMYATVRVGPYVCAEWDGGGYPVWLHFKTDMKLRQDDPQFEKYVGRWMDRVMPIVAKRQINRGGAVILVQLENEHPQGWGTSIPTNPVYGNYFRFLRDKALVNGLEVPWFFSGLHHGADPAGNGVWNSAGRVSPWYTTEFWPGWYDIYGPLDPDRFLKFDRGTWKIIAHGGNGYNYYMLYGGTNFEFTNNNEDAASYDYGAAIGEAGDLRPIYYRFKRAAMFARSFQRVLEDSRNASAAYDGTATNPAVKVTARVSPAGTIAFLDNPGKQPATTQIRFVGDTPVTLAPGEIVPVLNGVTISPGLKVSAIGRVLGVMQQDGVTTLVMYGPPGSHGMAVVNGQTALLTFPVASSTGETTTIGGLRILALSDDMADKTWFAEAGGKNWIITGANYVGDIALHEGRFQVDTAEPWKDSTLPSAVVYGSTGSFSLSRLNPQASISGPLVPVLGPWSSCSLAGFAAPFEADWSDRTDDPLPMGADGDISAYAWYRAGFKVPAAGDYALHFSDVGDRAWVYVDGKLTGSSKQRRRMGSPIKFDLPGVSLTPGDHLLAVFTSHYGRDKLFNFTGRIDLTDRKGISGPVSITLGTAGATPGGATVTGWEWRTAQGASESVPVASDTTGWQPAEIGRDVFGRKPGYAWYRATLPSTANGKGTISLHFESVDDNATVFFDGKKAIQHSGWDDPFGVSIPAGAQQVEVLVHNNDGVGGIAAPVTLEESGAGSGNLIHGWTMQGGPASPDRLPKALWHVGTGGASNFPAFYRATFDLKWSYGQDGPHPILRLSTPGMSKGFLYLNGHNIGRYPQIVPVDGLYLPENWLKPGRNEIVLLDEEGKSPEGAKIVVEEAASRTKTVLTTALPGGSK